MQGTPNSSNKVFNSYLDGSKKSVPNTPIALVDVRDVAEAHVLALEKEEARGRYFCAAVGSSFFGIAEMLRRLFPERTHLIPSQVDLKEGEKVRSAVRFDNSKVRSLGLEFRDIEQSVRESVEESVRKGFLNN